MSTENISDQDRAWFFTRIQNGDFKTICDFIDDKNEISPFDNKNNESAAAVALKSRQLAVYEVLISKAWCLNSNEIFHEIVKNLKKSLRAELREIHEKFQQQPNELISLVDTFLDRNCYISPNNYEEEKSALTIKYEQLISDDKVSKIVNEFDFALKSELREIHKRNFIKNPNEEYLTSLITRTSIYFGGNEATRNRKNYLDLIAGAYEQLNDIKEIRSIFKVVAKIKNLIIIFDFDRDSIEHVDPAGNPNIQGRTYAETGEVYIGAKALTAVNRSEALGVLAHELCHVAIFRIYNNDCKPYHKNDSEGEKEFESVLCNCETKLGKEMYIDVVLNGPEVIMHDELCVRVPHLLALYQENDEKIKFLKETFKKLFDYFERKTLLDLKKENELMSAVWKLKSKEPQYLTESKILFNPKAFELDLYTNEVLEISSNGPQMTMNWIFQETKSKSNFNFLFLALHHLKDEETFELFLDAHSSCMKPRIIINCDNEIEKEIEKIAQKMSEDKINERLIYIHNYKDHLIEGSNAREVSHSWLDLTKESKENLIKTMVSFQCKKIILEKIADLKSDALNFVPLKELLNNNLKIGKDLKFPEIDFHIKRNFLNYKYEEIETRKLLTIVEKSKLFLLSDDPGMGKTTELKILALLFKEKMKDFWVAFVDLKEYSEFYEKDENFKTVFNSPEEIANFFAQKIFKLNKFEEKIFKSLFCDDRVVLLLDGFDEINPSFKKFVTMMIISVRAHSKNILITSTRSHLKEELCEVLGVEAYTLKPLTEENCVEILEKSFEINGFAGEGLKVKLVRAREFLENLDRYSSNQVNNPLILRMVAKVFSDDQFAEVMQANIFSIYENFVLTMIMESMKKGEDARQEAASCLLIGFNFGSFYQKEAFKIIFEHNEAVKDKFENCFNLCFSEVQSPLNEHITRIALMKPDDPGKFQFVHRTFAEFFVADFLFKNVFDMKVLNDKKRKDQMNKEQLEAIFKIVQKVFALEWRNRSLVGWFFTVRSFIDGAFEKLIPDIGVIEKKVLKTTFSDLFASDKFSIYFKSLFDEKLSNIISAITRCANKQELKRLYIEQKYGDCRVIFQGNPLMMTARFASLFLNKKFTTLAREVLEEKDFLNYFTEKSQNGETVISCAYKSGNRDVFDFYVKTELFPSPYDGFSDTELYLKNASNLKLLFDKFLELKDISELRNELEKIEKEKGSEYLQLFLSSWTIEGDTFYNYIQSLLRNIENYEELWHLLQRILDENHFKVLVMKPTIAVGRMTPLMHKAFGKKKEVVISFWNFLSEVLTDDEKEKLLIDEEDYGLNLFDFALVNKDHETFIAIKDLYMKTIEEEKLKQILTRKRKNYESILFIPVSYGNLITIKAFWTFIQEFFDLTTQKTILLDTNIFGETFYWKIVDKKDFNKKMEIFEPFIEQHFTELEKDQFKNQNGLEKPWLRNYFNAENENGECVVSLAFKNNRNKPSPYDQLSRNELYSIIESKILRFLTKEGLTTLQNELEKIKEPSLALEYFQHFLNSWKTDKDLIYGGSIYLQACGYLSSMDDFEKLWNILSIILGENDFKTLLKKPDSKGTTPLKWKAQYHKKEVFISFWNLITQGLNNDEKEKFLTEEDEDGANLFDMSRINLNYKTHHEIKDLYVKHFETRHKVNDVDKRK